MTASAFDACKLFPEMIQYFWIYVDHLRMYLKAVPVGAGAVFLFDRFLKIGYNMFNKTADKEGQGFPFRRYNVSK